MLGLFFGGKISTNVSGKWGGQVGKRKGKNPTGWGGGSQGSGLRLPVRAAFPLYPSQVSGNQAKFLGPVGGAWAQWNTPQVGRYPVIRDTHVVKVGAVSTPKVCVIIHWHPLPSHLTGGIQIQRGEPRITGNPAACALPHCSWRTGSAAGGLLSTEGGWSLGRRASRHPCGQSPLRGGGGTAARRVREGGETVSQASKS